MDEKRKKIYFVRHGETEYNLNQLIQGRKIDADLNNKGKEQASDLYEHYKDYPFQRVYTSTLKRTWQTVDAFIQDNHPWTKLSGLDEMSYGIYEGKSIIQNGRFVFEDIRESWSKGEFSAKAPEGESLFDVVKRQKIAIKKIIESDENPVLVCMHGRAMKILLSWLTDRDYILMDEFDMPNTAVYKVEYDYQTEKFKILSACSTEHLKEDIKIER